MEHHAKRRRIEQPDEFEKKIQGSSGSSGSLAASSVEPASCATPAHSPKKRHSLNTSPLPGTPLRRNLVAPVPAKSPMTPRTKKNHETIRKAKAIVIEQYKATKPVSTDVAPKAQPKPQPKLLDPLGAKNNASPETREAQRLAQIEKFPCIEMEQEQVDEIEKAICKKLQGALTQPVGSLENTANDFHKKLNKAIKMGANSTFFIRGGPKSGKKLMVDHVLNQMKNLTVIKIMGNSREVEVFSQMANQLHPLASRGLPKTWYEKNGWMLNMMKNELKNKKVVVVVVDRFELLCQSRRQQFVYTLLDEMQKRKFRMILIGLSRDCSIQQSFEKRNVSRMHLVNFEIPTCSKADKLSLLKEHFLIKGTDKVPSCPPELIRSYNKLASLRLWQMLEEDASKGFEWRDNGGSPIGPFIDSCFPIERLLDGSHPVKPRHARGEFYGNIDNLSYTGLEIGIAMTKLYKREIHHGNTPGYINFQHIMKEITTLFKDSNFVGWNYTGQYDHEFQYMITKGIISMAPIVSNFNIIPDMHIPRNLIPLQLECFNLFNLYIEDLKKKGPVSEQRIKNNPLYSLPTAAQMWARQA